MAALFLLPLCFKDAIGSYYRLLSLSVPLSKERELLLLRFIRAQCSVRHLTSLGFVTMELGRFDVKLGQGMRGYVV